MTIKYTGKKINFLILSALMAFVLVSWQAAFAHAQVLTWKHGTTKAAAVESLKNELQRMGYTRYVRWDGCEARARVTRLFFRIVDVRGRVTDDAVIIERCRGMASGEVLKRCAEALKRLFPGGGGSDAQVQRR